jgi:hypothetical protein
LIISAAIRPRPFLVKGFGKGILQGTWQESKIAGLHDAGVAR